MREIRTSGSEGGGTGTTGPPYPYIHVALRADPWFRPCVYRIAQKSGVGGRVWNDSRGVETEVFGTAKTLDAFSRRLHEPSPPTPNARAGSRVFRGLVTPCCCPTHHPGSSRPPRPVAELVAGTGGAASGLAYRYRILEAGYTLAIPRMFTALALLAVSGVLLYALLSGVSYLVLRRWHESAVRREQSLRSD
jgi:Acylphosphatase